MYVRTPVTIDAMRYLLARLALHYPQAGRTPAQLELLAEDWCEDLSDFPLDVVKAAVARHRRQSAYFPTVAEILASCNDIQTEQKRIEALTLQALPEQRRDNPTPEELAKNVRRAQELLERIRRTLGVTIGR